MSQLEIKFNNIETKKYLEDIPNWKEKLQLRNLAIYNRDMAKEGRLNFNYKDGADAEVTKLNSDYGRVVAQTEKSLTGYRVIIDAPYRDAFKDILINPEEGDEILPHKETEVISIDTKDKKQKAA